MEPAHKLQTPKTNEKQSFGEDKEGFTEQVAWGLAE